VGTRTRGSRRSVGRRRNISSVASLGSNLFRLETVGIALLLIALLAIPWLVPATRGISDGRDWLIESLGVLVFALILLLVFVSVILLRRRTDWAFGAWRPWLGAALAAVFITGLAGFFRPDLQLGDVNIEDVTAGGDAGHLLVGSPLGILIWIASGVAAFWVISPSGFMAVARWLAETARAVRSWRLPQRAWASARAAFELVFPTRPPAEGSDKIPLDSVMWAQDADSDEDEDEYDEEEEEDENDEDEDEDEEDEEEEDEEESLEDYGEQGRLPLGGAEDEEDEELVVASGNGRRKARDGWALPPLDVLLDVTPQEGQADNAARARLIVDTLSSFGVDAKVVQVNEGPTVTQFGIEPGWEIKMQQVAERDSSGRPIVDKDGRPKVRAEEVSRTRVRVNRITTLANDLALALAAPSLRIESPVPGKPFVGIEVPNHTAALVTLRSVIESAQFRRTSLRSRLTLALGKSVSGEPIVADLAKMPHLLIAGATGSGKSVAINSIIACILMHASPEEVRFVMIDPKRVELTGFAPIPHLAFSSIVTDVENVVGTLQAVIHEMESRYRRFSSLGVRNIEAFNKHKKCPGQIPYWVVIIDELADLMMAAPYEVEKQICRLAQLARATGIHLIVATQRPSVDVVTGLIKANFPTRIAFAMSSQVDSRTILDSAGAEKLLGRGDMLYMPTDAAKPRRLQGVYVSDQEIERLVEFWTQDRFQELDREMFDYLLDEAAEAAEDEDAAEEDPLFQRAVELARDHQRVSTSMLQRRLRIGYPRAARLMDELEDAGIVGPAEGQGSRVVLAEPEEVAAD
jgi:S-DNA-T family DNA segregation ATPase FtsK/SpoIIIE